MRVIVNINGIRPERVGNDIFQDLRRIYPDGDQQRWFECSLPQDDPRLQAIIDRLARAGFQPWSDHFRKRQPSEYTLELSREYTAEDFQGVLYFEPIPNTYCEGLTRDHGGRLEINVDRLETDAEIALAYGSLLVVSPRIKTEIEAEGMRHAVFRPTVLVDELEGPVPWKGHGEPFWELTSDLLLPPISHSCTLFHDDGQIFTEDYSRGCIPKDGLYSHAELRYKASDLAAAGGFDFARTIECFGLRDPGHDNRRLVASRRFYDFCIARGLDMDWRPVHVEVE